MKRSARASLECLDQRGWRIEIGKALGKINRLMLVRQTGHFANDRFLKNGEA
jgi:hypothetical protein